MKAHKVFGVG